MPDEIVVTSTTSPEEEVAHTASENWRDPFEPKEVPAAEAAEEASEAEEAESASAEDTEEAEEEKPEPKKGKGGFQKRINTLTRRNHELEDRLADLETRLAKPAAAVSGEATPSKPKPSPDKFTTYEEYVEALADWKAEERFAKAKEAEAKSVQEQRQKETFQTYNQKTVEAKEKFEDWEEVVGQPNIQIPMVAQVAIIESENGPEIAYYLGKHPEVRERLLELNEFSQSRVVMEIGLISAHLAGEAEAVSPKPKPGTKAAAPIKPVGGSSTKSTVPLAEMPYQDFKKVRNQQDGSAAAVRENNLNA